MTYFRNFPQVYYDNTIATNLLVRVKFVESVTKNNYVLLDYELREGERPDTIAADYYGDARDAWIVMMSNITVDPYFEWYLPHEDFIKFIKAKYESLEAAYATTLFYRCNWANVDAVLTQSGYDALPEKAKKYWNPGLVGEVITHYERKKVDWTITTEAYEEIYSGDGDLIEEGSYYAAVSAYQWEYEANERRKHITLLDKTFALQIKRELRELLERDD